MFWNKIHEVKIMQRNFLKNFLTVQFVIIFLIYVPNLFAQKWAEEMFKVKNYSFGNVSKNAKAEYDFVIYNPYLEDIHIRSVSSSCSCTSVSVDKATIKTYETAKVKAQFNTDRFLGERSATLTVVIDQPYYATVQLQVKGNIRTNINFQPGEVNFGSVFAGNGSEKEVIFTYQGRNNWQVTELKSTNQNVAAELAEISRNAGQVKYRLKVKLSPNASDGYFNDRIILISNEGYNSEIPIMVQGVVKQGITVNPSKLFVGNLVPGQEVTKRIVLRAESPFAIKEITCPNDQYSFTFQRARTNTQSSTIQIVTVSYKAPESVVRQQFTDTIRIMTDAQPTALELQTYAKVLADDDEVNNSELLDEFAFSEEMKQSGMREGINILSRTNP